MLAISPAQRLELRARAHSLHPVVSIAENGLSASVVKEIERSLNAHELIKIRVYGDDREARITIYNTLCEQLNCAPIQHIGKLLVVYRPAPKPAATTPQAKPTSRRASGDSTAKKTPARKPADKTVRKFTPSPTSTKRTSSSDDSRSAPRPRSTAAPNKVASPGLGRRRTNGTTIKPAARVAPARSSTPRPSVRRSPKR